MSFHLNDKVEAALVLVIEPAVDLGTIAGVFPGKNSADKNLPCVICYADGDGEEDPKGTGNFWIKAVVQIKQSGVPNEDGTGQAPDPLPSDQALIDAVFGALMDDGLEAALSAAVADFTVFPNGIIREAPERGYDQSGTWVDSMGMKIYCCASSLAP